MGSRVNAQTSVYWDDKSDIQVVCGCFRGNLGEFENAVHKKYPDPEHEYHKFIARVKTYIEYSERGA